MFLRSRNVPACSFDSMPRSLASRTNARESRRSPSRSQAGRDRRGGVALLHDELDLRRVARGRLGHRRADVLAHDVVDERQLERGGVVGRPAEDRAVDQRPEGGDGDEQHDRRRGPARRAGTGRTRRCRGRRLRPAVAPAATAAARRLDVLRQVRGRVGVWVVGMGLGAASIPRASAGADRHVLLSGVSIGGSGHGRTESRPCVELILEDDRGGLPIHAGPVGVALGLRGRPARPAALHRTEAVLRELARQALVAKG